MGKKYDLSHSSDMNRFLNDLNNSVVSMAHSAAYNMNYDIECPHCHNHFQASAGINFCPICQKQVDVNLNQF